MQARITYYIGFCLGCSKVNSYTSSSTCAAAPPHSLRYHIMRVALPHALPPFLLPSFCCPLPSVENFKSSFAFCVYSHLYYIFLLLLLLLLLRFSCLFFFFMPLPCFSLILHPRRDAKWAITARFDCGPDVLNGSDVRIAIAIRHSPLALPNPKVHAKQQQQPLKLPFPPLLTVRCAIPQPPTNTQHSPFDCAPPQGEERERNPQMRTVAKLLWASSASSSVSGSIFRYHFASLVLCVFGFFFCCLFCFVCVYPFKCGA